MSLINYTSNPSIKRIKLDFSSACNANCIGCYSHADKKIPKKCAGCSNAVIKIGVKQQI
jgi:MoaA/NifB/PqqE/SkfB family radical SAM enzyme